VRRAMMNEALTLRITSLMGPEHGPTKGKEVDRNAVWGDETINTTHLSLKQFKKEYRKTLPKRERSTLSIVSDQYSVIRITNCTPQEDSNPGICEIL
jgi:hypothetical protein